MFATRYSVDETFEDDIAAWDEEGRPEGVQFILGTTGEVLQGLGAIESDIYINGDKISRILDEHKEMTLEEIKKIPEILDDPVLVLKSKNVWNVKTNSRLVLFGTTKAQNGLPVMCVMDLLPVENGLQLDDLQKVTSAYTKDVNPTSFLSKSEVLYADKKRTAPLLSSLGFTNAKEGATEQFYGSISYKRQNVNIQGENFQKVFPEATARGRELAGSGSTRFSMDEPVEETGTLIALHNLNSEKMNQTLDLGAWPSPSIAIVAIVQAEQGYTKYWAWTKVRALWS